MKMAANKTLPLVVEVDSGKGEVTIEITDETEPQTIEMKKGYTIRFRGLILTIPQTGLYRIQNAGVVSLGTRESILGDEEDRRFGQPHYGHD